MFIAALSLFGCFIKLWWSRGICKHIFPYSDHYTQETDKVCLKKASFITVDTSNWSVPMTLHNTTAWKTIKKGNHHQNRYCIFQKLIFPFINTFPLKGQKWFLQADEHDATWDDDQQTFSGADIHGFVQYNAEGRDFWWQGVVAAHLCVCVCIFIYWGGVSQLWSCDTWDVPKLNRAVTWLRRYRRCAVPLQRVLYQNKSTHVTGGQSSR